MAWPKGRPRPGKVREGGSPLEPKQEAPAPVVEEETQQDDTPRVPADWRVGALLNVRNYGTHYIITLWPEEYSPEHEERCIKFTNVGLCQDWVSKWYARQSHDPRAR